MARWPKAAATPQQLATVSSFHPDSQFLSKEQCTEQHEIHRIFFFKASPKVFLIEVQLIYNVVLISAVQQSDSVIHLNHFHILFHYSLSQDVEYSSLRYVVGPCYLSIL